MKNQLKKYQEEYKKQGFVLVKNFINKSECSKALKWLKKYISEVRPALARDTDPDALWLSREGKPLIPITYQKMLHTHAENAGLAGKVTGHTMRRACATHMLRNGAHPVAIQHLLGHADLSTLGQYLDLSLEDLRKMHEKSNPGR